MEVWRLRTATQLMEVKVLAGPLRSEVEALALPTRPFAVVRPPFRRDKITLPRHFHIVPLSEEREQRLLVTDLSDRPIRIWRFK